MDRLPDCGHRCQAKCHSRAMHEVFRCEQPCQRQHEVCGHSCQQLTYGEDCGRCEVVLTNVKLPCGHLKDDVSCYRTRHLKAIPCQVVVTKTVPGCGHTVLVQCSQELDDAYCCTSPCGATLICGHWCPGSCSRCTNEDQEGNRIVEHVRCDKVCHRPFGTCNHACPKRCHDGSGCGICMSGCEVSIKGSYDRSLFLRRHRYHASTLAAISSAMNHVHHVLSHAHGLVRMREHARCPARHLVTVFHAINAATDCFLAATGVLGSAERIAFRSIAQHVECSLTRRSTWLSSRSTGRSIWIRLQ